MNDMHNVLSQTSHLPIQAHSALVLGVMKSSDIRHVNFLSLEFIRSRFVCWWSLAKSTVRHASRHGRLQWSNPTQGQSDRHGFAMPRALKSVAVPQHAEILHFPSMDDIVRLLACQHMAFVAFMRT